MSLKGRLKRLEQRRGAGNPHVLFLRVPAGATDEQVEALKQAEMQRLGIKDEPDKLIVYLLVFA